MAKFKYVAMDSKGSEVEGTIDAESQTRAIALIREKGLFPTNVVEVGGRSAARPSRKPEARSEAAGSRGLQREIKMPAFLSRLLTGRVKLKHLVVFTRQLATLTDAGLPLLRGLRILQKQEKLPAMRDAIAGMAESVEGGSTFAEALAQQSRIFDKFFVNMVKAGEAGGALETILNRLAEFMEKAQRIRNKIKGAMVYPMVVLVMAVTIVTFLMIVVIPKFREIFQELLGGKGKELPALTEFVLKVSQVLAHQGGYVVIGIVVFVIVVRILARTAVGGLIVDRVKLGIPIFGPLFRKAATANFARTLGTLLTGGVPMLQALNIVREIAGNEVISRAVMQVHDSVKEGESIYLPMEASGVFPPMVISMIQVGEETGALPDMLMKIADTYDDEVDTAVEALTSIIEPILIILLAVIVGTIVIAMFLPLVRIISELG